MRFCEKCNVSVKGNLNKCPLCQGILKGEPEVRSFPLIPTIYKKFKLFFKLSVLASVVAVVSCFSVDVIISGTIEWSLYVLLGIICSWISLLVALKSRNHIPKNIAVQVYIASALCILWDYITHWNGWSIDYSLPILFTVAQISLATLSRIIKSRESECAFFMIFVGCGGIIPLVLFLTGKLNILIPSMVCISVSIISFVLLILFDGRVLAQELKRKFHI